MLSPIQGKMKEENTLMTSISHLSTVIATYSSLRTYYWNGTLKLLLKKLEKKDKNYCNLDQNIAIAI